MPTQLALVAAGLGVCIVPRLGRGDLPRGVRVVAVEPALSRHVYAIWRADAARRPVIRAAVEALRAAAAALPLHDRKEHSAPIGGRRERRGEPKVRAPRSGARSSSTM
jgi:hypothetical protein